MSDVVCGLGQVVDVALNGIVVAVGCDGQAVLAVGARMVADCGRRRGLAECRVHVVLLVVVVVLGQFRFVVDIRVVDQRDVVDEVVDEKLRVRHEVVDGVPGLRLLDAVVERATERFHHPHSRGRRLHWQWRQLHEWG